MKKKKPSDLLKNYLTVYKTPIAPDSLDPSVFYFPEQGGTPRLHPAIYTQISKDVSFLTGEHTQRIKGCYLVGGALVPGNNKRTQNLIVVILLNKDLMDLDIDGILAEEILKMTKYLSGKYASGTLRRIDYKPTLRKESLDRYSCVIDLQSQEWVKLPSNLKFLK